MKKISIKGLADFMTSAPAKQRSIIRQFKYPDEEEAKARITNYRDARDRVAAFHRSEHTRSWLLAEAHHLEGLANMSAGRTVDRMNHNARALRAYAKHFADRQFTVLDDLTLYLKHEDVIVTIHPDLHVQEDEREKVLKLEFSVRQPSDALVKIVAQAMFEATAVTNMHLVSSSVLYLDVPRGQIYRGARLGARMRKDIEAACMNISAIWDRI